MAETFVYLSEIAKIQPKSQDPGNEVAKISGSVWGFWKHSDSVASLSSNVELARL
jgi:hypothetical protein